VGKDINLHDPSPYWFVDTAPMVKYRSVPCFVWRQNIRQIELSMFITIGSSLSSNIFVNCVGGAGMVPDATSEHFSGKAPRVLPTTELY
jgi:hypothetical protein